MCPYLLKGRKRKMKNVKINKRRKIYNEEETLQVKKG